MFFKGTVGECVCIEMSFSMAFSIENLVNQLAPGVLGVSVIIIM